MRESVGEAVSDPVSEAGAKTGVVLVGFGGPRNLDEVEPMMSAVFGGRPVPPPVLASALKKYGLIGGASPLVAIATEITGKLLAAGQRGELEIAAALPGMQFSAPPLADSVARLREQGCRRLLYLSLTPFHSTSAYFAPLEQAREAALAAGCEFCAAQPIGLTAPYVAATATRLQAALAGADAPLVVFVAHSLPLDGSEDTGLYDGELRGAAQQVIATVTEASSEAGESRAEDAAESMEKAAEEALPWVCAYTSQGARGAAWLEPKAQAALDEARAQGARTLVVCPLGFATDHMEVLYDLDINLKAAAEDAGLSYRRSQTLGAADDALEAYLQVAREATVPPLSLRAKAKPERGNPDDRLQE